MRWASRPAHAKMTAMLPASRLLLGTSVLALLLVAGSCLTDFPALRDSSQSQDASKDQTSDALTESGGACEGGGKLCGESCVPTDDPAYGCASAFCNPCAFSDGVAKCSAGQCKLAGCGSGFANCDSDESTGCEAELAVDSKNCGSCGRDCLDGPCQNGSCTPIVVAAKQFNAWSVAVDTTHVYWTNAGGNAGLQRLEHSKSGQTPELLHSASGQGDLVLDQTHVYWANDDTGGVYRLPKQSPGAAQQIATAASPVGVAVDATHVYWADSGTSGASNGMVGRALKDGSSPEVLASGLESPFIIRLDVTHAYWTSLKGGAVNRLPKPGGSVSQLAPGKGTEPINGWGLVVTGGNVIWRDGEFIRQVAATGGNATDLSTAQPVARFLSREGTNLYWGRGTKTDTQIMTGSIPDLPATAPTPITAAPIPGQHGIASDQQYVYFTAWGSATVANGGVYKLARP